MPISAISHKLAAIKIFRIAAIFIAMTVAVWGRAAVNAHPHSTRVIKGVICDSLTLRPIESVTVIAEDGSTSVLSDADGNFIIGVPTGSEVLKISSIGYQKKTAKLHNDGSNFEMIYLAPTEYVMDELVVTRKKEKYSKKNNPAVEFVKRIRDARNLTDPVSRHENYRFSKYERTTLGINDFGSPEEKPELFKKYPFLREHIDTSDISGKPVLTISVDEKKSDIHFSDGNRKEYVSGIRHEGLDDIMDPKIVGTFISEAMREIDLYDNDINLLKNRFVSPLSPLAPDFYKFYLTDTVKIEDENCIVLTFVPRNSATFGFVGHIYVPEADSTMFIKKVTMTLPKKINVNFIDKLYIIQDFERAEDGSRLKTNDDLTLELSLLPGLQSMYARRHTAYGNHSFAPPEDALMFDFLGEEKIDIKARERDSIFWEEERMLNIEPSETNVSELQKSLQSIPLFRWGMSFIKLMSEGYLHTLPDNRSKFNIGPLNTLISHNSLQGWRYRIGGITTANLSKRWFGRGYVAWGSKDHKWAYGGEIEYSFIDKEYHSREFPVKSLRLSHKYDINQLGQHFLFTNPDNIFVSWQRMDDRLIDYRRLTSLEWTMEWENNLSFKLSANHVRQEATPWVPFVTGSGENFGHFQQASLGVELRFAPGEKVYQTISYRFPARMEAPIFILRHTVSPKGFAGSRFTINRTELDIQKRFWFSAWGYLDAILKAGHVWSKVAYPDLLIPNANLSYTIQPESFALMYPMEFINDSSVQWDMTYWANGAIFNYLPFFKNLKLREVFGFKGVWGHLSGKNNPDIDGDVFRFPEEAAAIPMDRGPYMEASVGLDNILRCLRVDYVWRLSYRDNPATDKGGVRIAFHMTF